MVRNRKPTERITHADEQIRAAVRAVTERKLSLRAASVDYNISKSSLARYVTKAREAIIQGEAITAISYQPRYNHAKVFNDDQERALSEYLLVASKMHAGLTRKMLMELAFEYAKMNQFIYPTSWDTNSQAGLFIFSILRYY